MKNSYKLWIIFSFILIFIAGALSGVLLERNLLDTNKQKEPPRRSPSPSHFPTLEEMAETLQLSGEQQEAIREVFSQSEARFKEWRKEIHKRFRSLRSRLLEDIKQVLNEDQKKQFDQMIEQMIEAFQSQRQKDRREREKDERQTDNKSRNQT
ncbi:MAG: hypothetical protein R6V02_01560 [Candidatus Aminicenantes bacterium]